VQLVFFLLVEAGIAALGVAAADDDAPSHTGAPSTAY
jgi:hypothetical protein